MQLGHAVAKLAEMKMSVIKLQSVIDTMRNRMDDISQGIAKVSELSQIAAGCSMVAVGPAHVPTGFSHKCGSMLASAAPIAE
jgi:hypothetical protein